MFLLPFLHYLKPYKTRLAVSIVCMVIVGALSIAPIVWLKETIDVFVKAGAGTVEELAKQDEITGGLASLMKDSGRHSTAEEWVSRHAWIAGNATAIQIAKKLDGWNGWYQVQKATKPYNALVALVVILVVLTTIKGVATYFSDYQLAYTFYKTNLQMREDLFNNIVRQDYLYFNSYSPGWLHSRINSDVKALQSILENILSNGVQQPVTIGATIGWMFWQDWRMTAGVLVLVPIVGGILYSFARSLRKNTRQEKKRTDLLSSSMTESLTNIRLVKAFGTEKIEIGKFHQRTQELFYYMMARRIAKFASRPIMEWLGTIAGCGVVLAGAWMIFNKELEFGVFCAYLFALTRLHRPLRGLATVVNKWQIARVSCERMDQMLRLKPVLIEADKAQPFESLKEAIEFESVGFRYDNKEILANVSLRVEAGKRVAFVGPSGSGKTTLVNMLARLFDPTEGRIVIDGADLRRLRLADWRKRLAIVTQENVLFDDTVANNIAYGSDSIEMERIETAARAANAHDFIMELDGGKGYQTVVGPTGARLSGGQRQRLAIARALYRDPQILILDEATSALDSHAQAVVQEALGRLMVGRTTFVIAHRISTIRDVDCIYVINDGRIIESGTHDELMASRGYYASLVIQSEASEIPAN